MKTKENINKYIRLLDKIGLSIISAQDLNEILDFTTNELVKEMEAVLVRIWTMKKGDLCKNTPGLCHFEFICDSRDKCLHLSSNAGIEDFKEEFQRVPIGAYQEGMVAKSGNRLLINNIQNDERVYDKRWIKKNRIVAFAGYPLLFSGELLGVMSLLSKKRIQEDEFEILGSVANQITIAIKNSRLRYDCEWKDTEKNRDRLRVRDLEEDLRWTEEKYQKVFNHTHDGIALIAPKTRELLEVNDNFAAMFGYPRGELQSMRLDDLHWQDGFRWIREELKEISRDESLSFRGVSFQRKNWERVSVDINAIQLEIKDRIYIQAFFKDVTKKMNLEKGSLELYALTKGIFDRVLTGICVIDREMKTVLANAAMRRWFPAMECNQKCYQNFFNAPNKEICPWCPTIKTLKDTQVHETDIEVSLCDQPPQPVHITSIPFFSSDGDLEYVIETVQDMSSWIQDQQAQVPRPLIPSRRVRS